MGSISGAKPKTLVSLVQSCATWWSAGVHRRCISRTHCSGAMVQAYGTSASLHGVPVTAATDLAAAEADSAAAVLLSSGAAP